MFVVFIYLFIDNIPVHIHHQQASEGHRLLQKVLPGLFEMRQSVFVEVRKDIYYMPLKYK